MNIFTIIFQILGFVLGIFLISLLASFLIWFIYYYYIKKMRFNDLGYKKIKNKSMFYRLFYEFPKIYWLDRFNATPRRV